MKNFLKVLALVLLVGCQHVLPSAFYYGKMEESYQNFLSEVEDCKDAAGFNTAKSDCEVEKLVDFGQQTQETAKIIISKDLKQSKPYIIYLEVSMVLINVNFDERIAYYPEAQKIAVQFLEVQRISGFFLNDARYYFVFFTTAAVSEDVLMKTNYLYVVKGDTRIGTLQKAIDEATNVRDLAAPKMKDNKESIKLLNVLLAIAKNSGWENESPQ